MLLRQGGWYTLDAASASVAQLALSAWMIRVQGLDAYGHWALALALLNFGALASFGVTPALSLRVQAPAATREWLPWLGAAVLLVMPAASIAIVALYLVGRIGFGFDAFDLGSSSRTAVLVPVLLSHLLVNEGIALTAATLRAAVSYRQAALCSLGFRLVAAIAVGAWCAFDATPEWMLCASLVVALSHLLTLIALLRRAHRDVHPGGASERRLCDRIRVLLQLARWQWLKSSGAMLFGAADRILIGHLLGPAVLAGYAVCLLLSDPLPRFTSMLAQPLMLWAGRVRDAGGHLIAHWRRFVAIELGIVLIGAVACLLLPWLLPLWFGAEAHRYATALPIAIAGSTLAALHMVVNHLLTGQDRNQRLAVASIAGAAAMLGAMAFIALRDGDLASLLACRWLYGFALFAAWPVLLRVARGSARDVART